MNKNIFTFAIQGLSRRKRQSFLIIFILIVSFTFAVIMMSYSSSIIKTNTENRFDTYGEWYGVIADAQDGDIEYLEGTEWIDTVGTTTTYGGIIANSTLEYIGTVDDDFIEVGRITMNSGRLPENAGEIAVEANTLNALGYDYTLGQEIVITVTANTDGIMPVTASETFILCGIIKEYTNIWTATDGSYSDLLNSAIITEESAEILMLDLQANADDSQLGSVNPPESALYFTVLSGSETTAENETNRYLAQSRSGVETRTKKLYINSLAYGDNIDAEYNTLYVTIILSVALLAVVIVFILQMSADVKRVVRIRSIGGTKLQVRLLILIETLLLCMPAIVIGALAGALGTWLFLKLSVFAGSISVIVDIPWVLLLCAGGAWLLCILIVRMLTVQVALSTPLYGNMGIQVGKIKKSQGLQQFLIVFVSCAFCVTLIFCVIGVLEPYYEYTRLSNTYWYWISSDGDIYNVSDEAIEQLSGVAGVKEVRGYSDLPVSVNTDDSNTVSTRLVVLSDTQWDSLIDFSKVDIEDYRNGDCVILSFPAGTEDLEIPQIGDTVILTVESTSVDETYSTDIAVTVGGINYYNNRALSTVGTVAFDLSNPYTIICSCSFLQNVLNALPENSYWSQMGINNGYLSGTDNVCYAFAVVFGDKNADSVITDTQIAKTVKDNSLSMYSYREWLQAEAQIYLQTLILLLVSGVAIAFVTLIILSSTIRLETQREKRRYGILQAIGMSKRQRNLELMRTALLRSVVAVVLGWGVFFLTVIFRNLESIKEEGATVFGVVSSYMSNITNYYMPVWAMVVMTVILFAVVFLICYLSKLSLNRYTLMEMLHGE